MKHFSPVLNPDTVPARLSLAARRCPTHHAEQMVKEQSPATKAFIAKARAAHGRRYDYSCSDYKGSETKLTIICPKHGPFRQSPYNHTNPRLQCGCPRCGNERSALRQSKGAAKSFVKRAQKVHGTKYDYSKAEYKHAHSKVSIICPIHGVFRQTANSHVRGLGCAKCGALRRGALRRRQAMEAFKGKAQLVHNGKYHYSEAVYYKASHKLTIICPKHGPFLQRPNNHLRGVGCPGCKAESTHQRCSKGFDQFVKDARAVHGRRYEYSGDYFNSGTPLNISCRLHGAFLQTPASHLHGGGCPVCAQAQRVRAMVMSHAEFVTRARKIHAGKGFTYPERYRRNDEKIGIRCQRHGLWRQSPNNHLHGFGCPKCQAVESSRRQRISHAAFVAKARKVHGKKFSYPEKYQTAVIPIRIVCPKHGEFWQIPNSHLSGNGCYRCIESFGERTVAIALGKLKLRFVCQKSFPDCKDVYRLRFDFFLPELKTLIEFDGQHHFQPIEGWGGDKAHLFVLHRDRIKNKWAKLNGYRLLRIPYTERDIMGLLSSELSE